MKDVNSANVHMTNRQWIGVRLFPLAPWIRMIDCDGFYQNRLK